MLTMVLGASTAALALAVAGLLVVWLGARRRLRQLSDECERRLEAERQACQRLEQRQQQADRLSGQLANSREENARLRKKVYELEQKLRARSEPEDETGAAAGRPSAGEQGASKLEELQKQLARSEQQRQQTEAELEKLRDQLERSRQKLQEDHQQAVRQRAADNEKIEQLEKEVGNLKKKLASARRKARNDEQVYRVTKSKLELALEKITVLEQALQAQAAGPGDGREDGAAPEVTEPPGGGS